MLQKVNLAKILFLDIETVPEEENFDQLSTYKKELWAQKTAYQRGPEDSPEDFINVQEYGLNLVKLYVFQWAILLFKRRNATLE